MVQGQFPGWKVLSAVLAPVAIPGKQIASVELDLVAGQAVIKQETDNPRHCHVEINCRDPVMPIWLKIPLELGYLQPASKVVVEIVALFQGYHFREIAT